MLLKASLVSLPEEFGLKKSRDLHQKVLTDIAIELHDLLFLYFSISQSLIQPDIKEQFTDPSHIALLEGIVRARVYPFEDIKEDIKEPGAVVVQKLPLHDHHIEHIAPGPLHDLLIRGGIRGIFFLQDLFCHRQVVRHMGMVIVGLEGLDIIPPLFGYKKSDPAKEGLQLLF